VPLHIVAGNYARPWLNMEIFFSIVTRQAIRRGTFTSVKDPIAAIDAFIDGRNERCRPVGIPRCRSAVQGDRELMNEG
jgi:hypothetical protein